MEEERWSCTGAEAIFEAKMRPFLSLPSSSFKTPPSVESRDGGSWEGHGLIDKVATCKGGLNGGWRHRCAILLLEDS